eukprot:m.479259 g.479259  ORF g.479259 m.479259 type:complete len:483 (+) comp21698_c0_seq11:176-1624(+)
MRRLQRFLVLGNSCYHRAVQSYQQQAMYSAANKTARRTKAALCKYGLDCRRVNVRHWSEYEHPEAHKVLVAEDLERSDATKGTQDKKTVLHTDVSQDQDGMASGGGTNSCGSLSGDQDDLGPLLEGETTTMQGSGSSVYTLKRFGGTYSCTCVAWKFQKGAGVVRTCKHLKKLRGEDAEAARLRNVVSVTKITDNTAIPATKRRRTDASGTTDIPDAASLDLEIALAHKWDSTKSVVGWMMSEKLDGMRCLWNGAGTLFSRAKNVIYAPDDFIGALPKGIVLDGELFLGRGRFQECMSICRRQDKCTKSWKEIRFVVFDAPCDQPFTDRLALARKAIEASTHHRLGDVVRVLEHTRCTGESHVHEELKRIEALGGEGVMLRNPTAHYVGGRTQDLLKVKSSHDAEAVVVAHVPGKGKHAGRLGALLCRMPGTTKEFKVGTGFTDNEREHPPAVGSTITYSYFELTKADIPRFPAYVRERPPE